jgi:predicted polyphosphate/ATP-dependent NAD kinase
VSKVGIIANPAAGKDVRRVVAYTTFISNIEKTNQLKGIILGIDSTGVDEILIMPDYDGLGQRALFGIGSHNIKAKTSILDMPAVFRAQDSALAAELMGKAGVGCIVTLGGDGTNREVARGRRDIPLVPVASGTNNVFPVMVDPASAGIAAGLVARQIVTGKECIRTHKRLVIIRDDVEVDMALIDAVVLDRRFIGARAIWDLDEVRQVVCTRAEPHYLGMTRLGGNLRPIGADDNHGIYVKLGRGKLRVRASVLHGLFSDVQVEEWKVLELDEEVEVTHKPSVIALDGEREVVVKASDNVKIRLQKDGPPVVDIEKTLKEAVKKGYFTS